MFVKSGIYYIPFVFMKIIFYITYLIILQYILLKVNMREITPLKNEKGIPH